MLEPIQRFAHALDIDNSRHPELLWYLAKVVIDSTITEKLGASKKRTAIIAAVIQIADR